MMHPVLFVFLLLCLPCCLAGGGACPSKLELKTCTCRLLKLKTELAQPIRRRREIAPPPTPPTAPPTENTNLGKNTAIQNPTKSPANGNKPPTRPTTSDFSKSESTHFTPTSDGFTQSTHHTESSHPTTSSDMPVSEMALQGRRMGGNPYAGDAFDEYTTDQPVQGEVPVQGGVGVLSRSMGAHGKMPPEMLPHERVESHFHLTVVDCKEPRTITEFEEILLFALHRRSVDKLIVSHLPPSKEETLARLPSKGMRNTRIKQFEIRDTALSGDFIWYGNPFEGQANSLLRFAANRCYLYGALTYEEPGTINTKGLHLLPHVEAIDFSTNHLTVIKASAFKFPPANLSSIVLSRNSLQALEAGCFQHVPHLRILDLSHNLLKTVIRTIFSAPARFLETINLSENFLDVLPVDFFVNMPALRNVNLARNFLHNMPEKPWITTWRQLMYVDVTGNFLYCDCHLLWLLPILSPSKINATVTPAPTPLPGQTIRGSCTYNRMPSYTPVKHSLVSLTREMLMC